MIDTYFEKLKTALTKPNDYVGQLSDYMKTGVLPQKEEPQVNPIETEIQGLKDKNYSYEDILESIENDNEIKNKNEAEQILDKLFNK